MTVRQKLGMILENKVLQKWSPKLIFLNNDKKKEKKEKKSPDF